MSQPGIFQGMEHCSQAMCLDILRTFSETGNGEATVLLMLRHVTQIAGASQAAILSPPSATGSPRTLVAIGGYDVTDAATSVDALGFTDLPIVQGRHVLGIFRYLCTPTRTVDDSVSSDLLSGVEYLAFALSKWNAEKANQIKLHRHEKIEKLLKRQNSFLKSLYKISLDMVNQKDYSQLMHSILQHSQTIMQANFASIYLLNENLSVMEMKFISSNVDPSVLGLTVRCGEGGAGHVWKTGKFLAIQNYSNWERRLSLPWLDRIGTIAFVPLFYLNKLIGIICLGFAEENRKITIPERSLLQQFANLAAMVSENVRLLNVLVKRDADFTHDIKLAAEVQQNYLPFNYNDSRLMIKTFFQPLHAVSGDLYNYFWTVHGDIIFGYVADVTGHGVTAALRTSALSALFQEAAGLSLPLMERAKWVHGRSLGYFSEGAYFAAICFELDLRRKELKVVCGGLYEFYMQTHYYTGRIQLTGSLMGLQRTPVFEERTYPAKAGDCFYFLSDGFSEQLESTEFPLHTFQATCDCLQELRTSSVAWDDMAGLCIQLKPNQQTAHIQQPELQLHFVGFDEFHTARIQITAFVEQNFPDVADDILLAFHEAAGNALRHGSALLPVLVRIQKYDSHMSIRIKDAGRGFDSRKYLPNGHPNASLPECNQRADNGRGIKLMLECMDKVCYSAAGNEVLLLKKLKQFS